MGDVPLGVGGEEMTLYLRSALDGKHEMILGHSRHPFT